MDKKTTILLDTAGFLAAVHNYKKSEIADLIVALCEFNLYGCTSVKLTDMKKIHFDSFKKLLNYAIRVGLKPARLTRKTQKSEQQIAKRPLSEIQASHLDQRKPTARKIKREIKRTIVN